MKPFATVARRGGRLGWTWPKTWAAVRAGRAFWDMEAAKYVARDAWQAGRADAGLPYVAVVE